MLRHPRRSALFPYTTLFRSDDGSDRRQAVFEPLADDLLRPGRGSFRLEEPRRAAGRDRSSASGSKDRKSTRLNSSHVEISYAVFCLKKKNTIPRTKNNPHQH